jgi:hypothetical protein
MKGTITNCLAELVETRFGKEKWVAIMAHAGAESTPNLRMPIADVEDSVAIKLLGSAAVVLGLSEEQATDAFGEYWCCTYAPRIYGSIIRRFKTAKELIVGLDDVHVKTTAAIPNARPPRFKYRWLNDTDLEVTYMSHRNLLQVYIGLARGVGKYYNTPLEVSATSKDKVVIRGL